MTDRTPHLEPVAPPAPPLDTEPSVTPPPRPAPAPEPRRALPSPAVVLERAESAVGWLERAARIYRVARALLRRAA